MTILRFLESNKGTVSDSRYLYGRVYAPEYTLFSVVNESNSNLVEKIYQLPPCEFGFDITQDEAFSLSITLSNTRLQVLKVEADTLIYYSGYFTTSYYTASNSILAIEPSYDSAFITAYDSTNNQPFICQWGVDEVSKDFNCVEFTNYNFPRALVAIDVSKTVTAIRLNNGTNNMNFVLLDYSDNINVAQWASSITCPDASCTLYHSEGSISDDQSTVIFLVGYNDIALMTRMNTSSGAFDTIKFSTLNTSST